VPPLQQPPLQQQGQQHAGATRESEAPAEPGADDSPAVGGLHGGAPGAAARPSLPGRQLSDTL
jgi:hypothetical protein